MLGKKYNCIMWVIVFALLIVATFCDLMLSKSIFNINSIYGKIFETIGEMPAMLIASFCALLLLMTRPTDKKWKNILAFMGYGFLFVAFAVFAGVLVINYTKWHFSIAIAFALVFGVGIFFLAQAVDKSNRKRIVQIALVGLIVFFVSVLVINLAKLGWNRMRFRNMAELGDYSNFTKWFLPQRKGIIADSEAYKSFPSGHAGNATVIIWITLLPYLSEKLNKKCIKICLHIVAWVWIIVVNISRIIMGAHFLSDTLVGMSITLAAFELLCKLIKIQSIKSEVK